MRQPIETEIGLLKEHGNIISFLYPALNKPLVSKMAERKLTAFGGLFAQIFYCFNTTEKENQSILPF